MKWLKERDELIAQTEAFVKSVTARRPAAAAAVSTARSAPIENPFVPIATRPAAENPVSQPAVKPSPMDIGASVQSSIPVEPTEAPPRAEPPPIVAFAEGEVRKEIQTRVAAFRANQHRFQREREAYYNAVLTKARSTGQEDNSR